MSRRVESASASALWTAGVLALVPTAFSLGSWLRMPQVEPLVMAWRAGGALPLLMGQGGERWRIATAGLLHLDGQHLLLNGICLLGLGFVCGRLLGPGRTALIALLSCVGSAAAVGLWAGVPTVGASGAVFGLIGAGAVAWAQQRRTLDEHTRSILGGLLLFFALSAVTVTWQGRGSQIAHLSGGAIGFVGALLLWRPIRVWMPGLVFASLAAWAGWGLSQVDAQRWILGPAQIPCERTVTNGLAFVCRAGVGPDWHADAFDHDLGPWKDRGRWFGRGLDGALGPRLINARVAGVGRGLVWIRAGAQAFDVADLDHAVQSFDEVAQE